MRRYVAWEPSPLEHIESLEQLRILWYGERILVETAKASSGISIDSKEDLQLARMKFDM